MKTDNTAYRSTLGIVLAAASLLLIPLVAMQFTDEVTWSLTDFAVAGTLLVGTALTYQLVARKAGNLAYRAAVGVALAAALMLVWANLAVGFIGSENNPANLMFFGVIAVGIIGAVLARLQPQGMARALFATALAQALAAVLAMIFGLGSEERGLLELLAPTAFFVALFVGSGLLFRQAARGQASASAGKG